MWIETNSLFQVPVTALKTPKKENLMPYPSGESSLLFLYFLTFSQILIVLFLLCIFYVTLHYLSLLVQVNKYWGLFLVNIWYVWVSSILVPWIMHKITHHSQNPCIIITPPAWKKDQHWSIFNSLENMQAVLIFTLILMMLYLLRI